MTEEKGRQRRCEDGRDGNVEGMRVWRGSEGGRDGSIEEEISFYSQ